MKLQGIFPAMATPFDHAGNLYITKIQHNVEKWNRTGLAGYLVCGSTGETYSFPRKRNARSGSRSPSMRRPRSFSLRHRHGKRARNRVPHQPRRRVGLPGRPGAHTPLLQEPDERACRRRSTFERSPTRPTFRLLIYNFPQATGVDIPAMPWRRSPNIPTSSASRKAPEMWRRSCRCPRGAARFSSAGGLRAHVVARADDGRVRRPSWRMPMPRRTPPSRSGKRSARAKKRPACDWQNRIGRAATLVTSKYGIPGLKHAMDLNGYYGGPPRLPLSVPTPAAKKEIEEAFKDLKG